MIAELRAWLAVKLIGWAFDLWPRHTFETATTMLALMREMGSIDVRDDPEIAGRV